MRKITKKQAFGVVVLFMIGIAIILTLVNAI